MEDGQTGGLIVAVAVPVGVVPKPGQEFATTRGPEMEARIAGVLLGKLQGVTLKFAVSFSFANNYVLDINCQDDLVGHVLSPHVIVLHSYEWKMVRVGAI